MKDLYVLWRGNPSYKRVLLRRVSWWWLYWGNLKLHFEPNKKSPKHWFWNIQILFLGTEKYNGCLTIRVLNQVIEIGW